MNVILCPLCISDPVRPPIHDALLITWNANFFLFCFVSFPFCLLSKTKDADNASDSDDDGPGLFDSDDDDDDDDEPKRKPMTKRQRMEALRAKKRQETAKLSSSGNKPDGYDWRTRTTLLSMFGPRKIMTLLILKGMTRMRLMNFIRIRSLMMNAVRQKKKYLKRRKSRGLVLPGDVRNGQS